MTATTLVSLNEVSLAAQVTLRTMQRYLGRTTIKPTNRDRRSGKNLYNNEAVFTLLMENGFDGDELDNIMSKLFPEYKVVENYDHEPVSVEVVEEIEPNYQQQVEQDLDDASSSALATANHWKRFEERSLDDVDALADQMAAKIINRFSSRLASKVDAGLGDIGGSAVSR